VKIILTHENADFDAVAALLAAHKLNPDAVPVLPARLNQNVADFVALYQNGLPFVKQADFRIKGLRHITLVDTQRLPSLRGIRRDTPVQIIDHHSLVDNLPPHHTFAGESLGATTTLLVEQIQQQAIILNSLEATLLALGIYEDTGSLTYSPTTARDLLATAWLLQQNAVLETIRRFLSPALNSEQQNLYDTLLASAESRTIHGRTIMVATAQADHNISEISSVAHRLRDTLDPSALFVLVAMPDSLQLVARATNGVVDAGEIARSFGGGGHEFAAAASIRDQLLNEAVAMLWEQLHRAVHPSVRVADLMSYGVQTVDPDSRLDDIVQKLRRIGHEGFPVIDDGHVVGLLTRRDVDRAIEHGLGSLRVRDVMTSGEVTLHLDDALATLEQGMVTSGWGQIPVVDENDSLIGIVTRTDLIKQWAKTHPPIKANIQLVSASQIEEVLGSSVHTFIETVAQHAEQLGMTLYMVGGAVRDLLLSRRNLDIDFVAEQDAIHLTETLKTHFGGKIQSHRPFGTATWTLDEQAAASLGLKLDDLPSHIDFATARNEFYEHPTALPTVYDSSIKLDLQRRDFTINTLAIQISPIASRGRILNFYGGLADLHAGLIRVLHSLSFVDDPTRILRAVRFEQRLGFTIEPRTAELIHTALPMLRRITGERLRNELTLLLREKEPESGLLKLHSLGALEAFHPSFVIDETIRGHFQAVRALQLPWPMEHPAIDDLYWHILATRIPSDRLPDLTEHLLFARTTADSMLGAAKLVQRSNFLTAPDALPSQIVHELEGVSELALLTAWLIWDNSLAPERIRQYMLEWRDIRPKSDGHSLQALGVPPGPCYSTVLNQLRAAHLDGIVKSDDDEQALLHNLIEELCRDAT
jgi:tRNA nucleotidyltransferase (CCA-adding enzyme)